jgi:hypothetical protein
MFLLFIVDGGQIGGVIDDGKNLQCEQKPYAGSFTAQSDTLLKGTNV